MAEPRFVGALDQGTTSTRFLIFDRAARVVALSRREHAQICPRPGWVEHDAAEIRRNAERVVAQAMAQARLRPADLAAVGVTNQRETAVVWSRRDGRALAPAVVWQDGRTAGEAAQLERREGARLRRLTGLPPSSYFSALKLKWLLRHVPGLRARAARGEALFGTVDSFLLWSLTGGPRGGVHATDVTNASRTQMMDLRAARWDDGLLELFGVPRAMLPEIRSSSEIYGRAVLASIRGVPVAGLVGDQQAALLGQGCRRIGQAKCTYGTGAFLLMHTGARAVASRAGLLTTAAARLGGERAQYALEGSAAEAGSVVQWLRDGLGLIDSSAEVEALARTVPDNGGVYLVPAFSGLLAPRWNAGARGLIGGLTRHARAGHLARAALESAAYQVRELVAAMERDAGRRLDSLRVDGGMSADELLMQFQADLLGRPVSRPRMLETTALGAAFAAARAVGFWTEEAPPRPRRLDRAWRPRLDARGRARLISGWERAVDRSLDWNDAPR